MILAGIASLPSLVLGWLCVRLFTAKHAFPSSWLGWITELALACGIGTGLTSAIFFLMLWAGVTGSVPTLFVEGALIVAVGLVAWRQGAFAAAAALNEDANFGWIWLLRAAALVAVVFLVAGFAESTAANPNGEWDAFSIWNLRAKFLAGGAASWRLATSNELATRSAGPSHPSYPLLVSASVARLWVISGTDSVEAPALFSIAFTLATGLAIYGLLSWARSEVFGLLALCILFGTETFVSQAASQYADIPLSFFILSSVALAAIAAERNWDHGLLTLAGLLSGFAAWTKNEGIAFLALLLLAAFWKARGKALYLLAGVLPGALVTLAFKLFVAQGREQMFPATIGDAVTRLADAGRWMQVATSYVRNAWQLGPPWAHPVLLLALLAYFAGVAPRAEVCRKLWLVIPVAGLLAADFGIYLLTTADLTWHLGTSNGRLFAQAWPTAVFLSFLFMRVPISKAEPPAVAAKERPARKRK